MELLEQIVFFFSDIIPSFVYFGVLLAALIYFFLGWHRRKDEPTYDFPKDDPDAYKPIVSESGLKKSTERDESSD